jgi:hypothetical protein
VDSEISKEMRENRQTIDPVNTWTNQITAGKIKLAVYSFEENVE